MDEENDICEVKSDSITTDDVNITVARQGNVDHLHPNASSASSPPDRHRPTAKTEHERCRAAGILVGAFVFAMFAWIMLALALGWRWPMYQTQYHTAVMVTIPSFFVIIRYVRMGTGIGDTGDNKLVGDKLLSVSPICKYSPPTNTILFLSSRGYIRRLDCSHFPPRCYGDSHMSHMGICSGCCYAFIIESLSRIHLSKPAGHPHVNELLHFVRNGIETRQCYAEG